MITQIQAFRNMKRTIYLIILTGSFQALLAQTTYPTVWTDVINATVNPDNTVTGPLIGTGWTAGAASKNMLSPGADGYVEFTYSSTGGTSYMVALTRPNINPSYVGNDYGIQVSGSSLYVWPPGATGGQLLGTLANGDVVRLSHETTSYKVYKNGTVVKAYGGGAITDYLRLDVSFGNPSTIPVIRCSFQVPLLATPVIHNPSLANNDGSITVVPDGQTDPVTYSWSSGETTATITGKARGAYTVTVTDALAKTFTKTYNLGYDVAWTNVKNLTMNADNSLTKTDLAGFWTSGASSLNVLPPNTDGWVEFTMGDVGSRYMIGLSRIDETESYSTIDACWFIQEINSTATYEQGINKANLGGGRKGDVFRVAREGALIKYYYNGVAKRSLAVSATVPYVIDVSSCIGTMPMMTASFDRKITVLPSYVLPDVSSNQGGSIALNIQGAYAPYSVSWSSGETSNLISNKPRGEYTVTITDAASRTFVRKYYLGYPLSWTDFQGTSLTSDNAVYKSLNDGNGLFDAGALSATTLNSMDNGWIECQLPPATSIVLMGLARSNSVPGSFDYGFYFNGLGDVLIYESGTNRNVTTSQVEGSIFRIERDNGSIKYWVDGVLVRTVATTQSYQLFVDCSLSKGRLSMITSSFTRAPQTFYAIADGAWTDPNTWSLTEGGTAAAMYPASGDLVVVKANAVTVTSGVNSSNVKINATSENAALKITGTAATLTVKGNVELKGLSNTQTAKALVLESGGRINVVTP